MRGAIPPLPNTSSWCGTYLSIGTTLPLPLRVCATSFQANGPYRYKITPNLHGVQIEILYNFLAEQNIVKCLLT
jgi:hypothetical protein